MGEGNARLWHSDKLDRLLGRNGERQGLGVGEADIFARENDNAAGQAFGLAKLVSKAWVSPEGGPNVSVHDGLASKGLRSVREQKSVVQAAECSANFRSLIHSRTSPSLVLTAFKSHLLCQLS